MAKKTDKSFCVIDHANKHADRESTNPNRKKSRSLRGPGRVGVAAKDTVPSADKDDPPENLADEDWATASS